MVYDSLSEQAAHNLRQWREHRAFAPWKNEVEKFIASASTVEIEDAFYRKIPFGTGGRRGRMGVGPNRINSRTIGETALAVARWVKPGASVAIACDTRHKSFSFARISARVFSQAGVYVGMFAAPRPTPMLSMMVRDGKFEAGVVITASHNPPSDNGFKVYNSHGGQIFSHSEKEAISLFTHYGEPEEIDCSDWDDPPEGVSIFPDFVDRSYAVACSMTALTNNRDINVYYTPLHGAGLPSIVQALSAAEFPHITIVEEQASADGDFSTIADQVPNPESEVAMSLVVAAAQKAGADIAIATDPDADRLGVCAPDKDGVWKKMTGNQVAAILAWHVLSHHHHLNEIPHEAVIARTAVTTPLLDQIAEKFGVKVVNDLLVGFKHIGAAMQELREGTLLFAAEESHGYLAGNHARDKDAGTAAVLMCEAAAVAKARGETLWSTLDALYDAYGYYAESLQTRRIEGAAGTAKIQKAMDSLRAEPLKHICELVVVKEIDRLKPYGSINPQTGSPFINLSETTDNMLFYKLEGVDALNSCRKGTLAVRPSGTESAYKVYVFLSDPIATRETLDKAAAQMALEMVDIIELRGQNG